MPMTSRSIRSPFGYCRSPGTITIPIVFDHRAVAEKRAGVT